MQPGNDLHDELHTDEFRQARYHIGRAEDDLDLAIADIHRIRDLLSASAEWCQEFSDDAVVLRSKLDMLSSLIPRHR